MTRTPTPTPDYTNVAQQRILMLLVTLAGHEVRGLSPSQVCAELGIGASMATRDLQNLHTAGFAEVLPETGGWRLTPKVVEISVRHAVAMQRAQSRLTETAARFSRSG